MKLSTKTTYGLRALIRLASTNSEKSMSVANIAQIEDLSSAYLERIFGSLKRAKLVLATKGVTGGYCLAHAPEKISVLMVTTALEKNPNLFQCIKKNDSGVCNSQCSCQADSALLEIENKIQKTLASITINDLVKIKHHE